MKIHTILPVLLLALLAVSCSPSSDSGSEDASAGSDPVLPFIEDDYGTALAKAKADGLPIFVEVWAPW